MVVYDARDISIDKGNISIGLNVQRIQSTSKKSKKKLFRTKKDNNIIGNVDNKGLIYNVFRLLVYLIILFYMSFWNP